MGHSYIGINIYTKNAARSFEFYRGLGFAIINEGDPNTEWFGAQFRLLAGNDEPTLWIWKNPDDRIVRNNIVMHSDDIEQTYEELKGKGYAVDPPEMQFYGGKEMNLVDPDGNEVLFLS